MKLTAVHTNFLHRMNSEHWSGQEEKDVIDFMTAIQSYFAIPVRRDSDIGYHLLNELKLLLVFVGRVCDVDEVILHEGCRDTESIEASYVRLLLHIWTYSLNISFLASKSSISFPGDIVLVVPADFTGLLHQQILALLLADLMTVSLNRFTGFPANGDISTLNPFPAHFFLQELQNIRDSVLKYETADAYWSVVNMIIQKMEEWKEQETQSIHHFALFSRSLKKPNDTKIARLWLLMLLSRLESNGNTLNPDALSAVVKEIVQRETSFLDSSSTSILLVIQIVRALFDSLGPNVDLVLPFFEITIRRLNKSDGCLMISVPKHGSEWIQMISHPKPAADIRQDLFLSVLSICELIVRDSSTECDLERASQLQRLKGRLFSKIQAKRLQELNEQGLFKFLTLFLAIGSWKQDQWPEMSEKVCEISRNIFDLGDSTKIQLTIKCLFALLNMMSATCDGNRVKQILIRQIPLLPSSDSKHPIAVRVSTISSSLKLLFSSGYVSCSSLLFDFASCFSEECFTHAAPVIDSLSFLLEPLVCSWPFS